MEIVQKLRRFDFPECSRLALEHLSINSSKDSLSIPGLGDSSDDATEQIVKELIFGHAANFSALKELQVLEVVSKFVLEQSNDQVRHFVFKALFGNISDVADYKFKFLQRLVSYSISVKNYKILDSTALWMQNSGCKSDLTLSLVEHIINDHVVIVKSKINSSLYEIAQTSPTFVCNVIITVTQKYSLPARENNLSELDKKSLPKLILTYDILDVLCEWLMYNPIIGLTSLFPSQSSYLNQQRQTLWTCPSKPNTLTPVPGLIRWSIKVPFLLDNCWDPNSDELPDEKYLLWSKLHLAILQTIEAFATLPGANQLELITLADMNSIINDASQSLQSCKNENEAIYQLALDRVVQVLQVSLSTGAFRCSLADLRNICKKLPPSKLLSMVERQHLNIGPPQMHNAS